MKSTIILCSLILTSTFLACNSTYNADLQALKDRIIKANDEMLNKGNVDFADEVFADSYRGQGPGVIKGMVKNLRRAFPDLQVTIEPIVAEGNMTGWRRVHTGTHKDTILGFPPTGKKLSWEAVILSRYEDGKVVEEWGQTNLLEVLQEANRPDPKAEDVIAALQSTIDALNNQDAEAYVAHLHPNQTRFLPQSQDLFRGVSVAAMQKSFQDGNRFDLKMEDLHVDFYGNTAIVTGYQTGPHNLPDGRVIEGKRKYSIVFIYEGGQWKSVHLHT